MLWVSERNKLEGITKDKLMAMVNQFENYMASSLWQEHSDLWQEVENGVDRVEDLG